MASAVVAVFNEYNEAQSAVNELLVAGFDKKEIQISGENGSTTPARPRAEKGVKGFFKSLFNKQEEGDRDIRLYDEAVRHGNFVVTAIAANDEKSDIASEVLSHHHPLDLDERSSEWLGEQATTPGPAPEPAGTRVAGRSIPVVEEDVQVGKREVTRGGVRIFQRITEVPIDEEVTLREERVVVERVPVDRPAGAADAGAFKEGVTEVRETAEEPVVSKVARVVEEVKIGKEVTERKQRVKDTARTTEVEVERSGDEDYRSDWQQKYGSEGGAYEDYAPAYAYGSTAAGSRQFEGKRFADVEPDLQRDWEARNPGSKWERFKDAIRTGFEKLRR